MINYVSAYQIYSPKLFEDIATLSGLTMNSFIRLSPYQISQFVNSMQCFTQGAVNAFVKKIPGLSGDCFVALTADTKGNEVLVFDVVRPDDPSRTSCYVMDQEPIYIWKQNPGWVDVSSAIKDFHLSCDGRTFPLSAYIQLSSFLEDKRDMSIAWNEVVDIDPGIYSAISKGLTVAEKSLQHQ